MSVLSESVDNEILDVLLNMRLRTDKTVVMTFINGAGEKVKLHLMPDAARDVCEELSELGLCH